MLDPSEQWRAEADGALLGLAKRRQLLTSDDLHDAIGDPPEPNQVGAAFNRAQAQGLLRWTRSMVASRRPEAKGRLVKLWESRLVETEPGDPVARYIDDPQEALF